MLGRTLSRACLLLRGDPNPEAETSTQGGTAMPAGPQHRDRASTQNIPASPGPGVTGSAVDGHSPQHPEARQAVSLLGASSL